MCASISTVIRPICLCFYCLSDDEHTLTHTHTRTLETPINSVEAGGTCMQAFNFTMSGRFEVQKGKVQFWLELQRAPFIFFKSVFLVTQPEPASKSRRTAHGVQVGNTQPFPPFPPADPLSALRDKLSDSPSPSPRPPRSLSHLSAEGAGLLWRWEWSVRPLNS